MKNSIEIMLEEYFKLSQAEKNIKEKKDELNEQIKEALDKADLKKIECENGLTASIVDKVNIKYTDEIAVKQYLKKQNLLNYIVEKVNTTELNKELRKDTKISNNLKNYFTKESTQSLSVKGEIICQD